MLNLSIANMNPAYIEEICADLLDQQKRGIADCAMMMMQFAPEGTPPEPKAEQQCRTYDLFRERLDKMGVKHGVLVQSTLGHVFPPSRPHPFQKVIGLVTGTQYDVYKPYDKTQMDGIVFQCQCCPYDKNLQAYLREQMRTLASRHPSVIMIDDDMGLLYRVGIKGCSCPLHMAEFNRRAGTSLTREELLPHIYGNSEEDRRLTQIFIDVQGDSLVQAVRAMREGIDEADPSIQGVVSSAGSYCEFTEQMAEAFAGRGNPTAARFNNGCFGSETSRYFSGYMLRAAVQREHLRGKIDLFLTEGDTCPHNRYAVSAARLHAHMTGTILEGAKGVKAWITSLGGSGFDLSAGRAYRNILAKHRGFYEKLAQLYDGCRFTGCRIPVPQTRDFSIRTANIFQTPLSCWATKVLERYGVPMYASKEAGGAVFLDEAAVPGFTDEEIRTLLGGTLFLSASAAQMLISRGFGNDIGTDVREWTGGLITAEHIRVTGTDIRRQFGGMELVPLFTETETLSDALYQPGDGTKQAMYPAVTSYRNARGGTVIVFSGTPDVAFHYDRSVSFLNSARKKQICSVLARTGNLPVYYPEDLEIYMKAGFLPDGTLLCALFNLSLDPLEDIPLICADPVREIGILTPEGDVRPCTFLREDGMIRISEPLYPMQPVILLLR